MTSTQTIASVPVIAMSREIDLAARVDAARKAKGTSPFVGIATERGTVMLRRDVLKKSLQGLRVIEAELVESEDGTITGDLYFDAGRTSYRAKLAIRVYAIGERVKSVRLFIHQPWKIGSGVMHPLLESWQRANMRKWGVCDCHDFYRRKTCKHVETATRPKMNKYEKAIAKLEKEMPREWRPGNPAVEMCDRPPADDHLRRRWLAWTLQKDARRAVMALARRGTHGDLSSTKLYAEVAKLIAPHIAIANQQEILDALNAGKPTTEWPKEIYAVEVRPITIKKWGEITAYERDHGNTPDLFAYLGKLWQFCGLTTKPARYDHGPRWGAEHYKAWLRDLHTRKQLISQIAAIRAEMPEPKPPSHVEAFDVTADGTVTNKTVTP